MMQNRYRASHHGSTKLLKARLLKTMLWSRALFIVCAFLFTSSVLFAQAPERHKCEGRKQLLFVIGVSNTMTTNERLSEVKQFVLRTLKDRSLENLLYKVISFGGSCNDLAVEVDWTRDASVVSAGVKGLYVRGGTPLGSAVEFAIDEIKKSAYPDETQVVLLADGVNECGKLSDIIPRRASEIPCAAFITLGIELQESDALAGNRATDDLKMLAAQTGGTYIPLQDVRELRGVSVNDTGISVQAVQFEPRAKPIKQQPTTQTSAQLASNTTQASTTENTKENSSASNSASNTHSNTATPKPTPDSSRSGRAASTQATTEQSTALPSTRQEPNASPNQTPTQEQQPTQQPPKQQEKPSPKGASKRPQRSTTTAKAQTDSKPQILTPKPNGERTPTTNLAPKQIATEQIALKQNESPTKIPPVSSAIAKSSQMASGVTAEDAPTNTTLVLQFYAKSTALLPHSQQDLEDFIQYLLHYINRQPKVRIIVDGHSSQEGTRVENLRLSVGRASAVAAALRTRTKLSDTAVSWNAFGALRPLLGETTPAARMNNRRVEIRVLW